MSYVEGGWASSTTPIALPSRSGWGGVGGWQRSLRQPATCAPFGPKYNYAAEESLVPTSDGCSSTYRERVALTFLRMTQWFLPLGRS